MTTANREQVLETMLRLAKPYCPIRVQEDIEKVLAHDADTFALVCEFCGTPCNKVAVCRSCWYEGRTFARDFASLIEAIGAITGIGAVTVIHTGGGNFGLRIAMRDSNVIAFATADDDSMLPASERGPWMVGVYQTEAALYEGGLDEEFHVSSREALLATLRDVATCVLCGRLQHQAAAITGTQCPQCGRGNEETLCASCHSHLATTPRLDRLVCDGCAHNIDMHGARLFDAFAADPCDEGAQ